MAYRPNPDCYLFLCGYSFKWLGKKKKRFNHEQVWLCFNITLFMVIEIHFMNVFDFFFPNHLKL